MLMKQVRQYQLGCGTNALSYSCASHATTAAGSRANAHCRLSSEDANSNYRRITFCSTALLA